MMWLRCFALRCKLKWDFGVEQLLFPEGRRCKKSCSTPKSHFSLHLSAKQRSRIVWFHRHKIELKYALCLSQGGRMGYPAWISWWVSFRWFQNFGLSLAPISVTLGQGHQTTEAGQNLTGPHNKNRSSNRYKTYTYVYSLAYHLIKFWRKLYETFF